MKTNLILIAIVSTFLLSSCASKIPYTNGVIEQYKLTESEIKSIQFYTSADIELVRGESQKSEKGTKEGQLVISSQRSDEQVLIPKGTKGVVVGVYDDSKVAVSFETDDKFIGFGDPNNRGRYTLLASDWANGKGKLEYGGKEYYATSASANAYLIFQMKRIRKYRKSAHVVGGRKIN